MGRTLPRTPRRVAVGAVVMGALVLAACGSSSPTSSSSSGGAQSSQPTLQSNIAAEVPAALKAKGSIQVGTDTTYAPNEFIDPASNKPVGWEVDLAGALGKVLGIPLVVTTADFSTIIPNLGTRFDIGISSFTPTTEREKTVDFVTYYQAGEAWFIKKGGPTISQAADMCGKSVAVQTGTTEESDAWGYMGKKPDGSAIAGDADNCQKAGKQDITVHSFTKQTEANSDVIGGRAQVGWSDEPVARYQIKLQPDQLTLSGSACSVAPYGIAIPKGSAMAQALTDAIKYLIDNGFYTSILAQWNVQSGAVKSSDVALNKNDSGGAGGASCVPSY